MVRTRHGPPSSCTIVIKLGTSSIVHETTHQPLLSTLSAVVETVVRLRNDGHKVVLVSSGAIGVGLRRMDISHRPKSLSGKQALAAIGQGRLIALWDNLFGQLEQPIAQVLLTRGDIADRTRYLNAANTFRELLSMGVVPIVNENDTVSVSEIKFGDNDTLSAITSSMIHADYLFLLTDVDGLYTSNPRKDPSAKLIEAVSSVATIRAEVSTKTLGSKLGTGGMETKLIAAEIATAAGVATIIASSKHPEDISAIIEYNNALRSFPFRTQESDEQKKNEDALDRSRMSTGEPLKSRPLHTIFMPSPIPMTDLKAWTSHTLFPSGSVIIDHGAHHVLSRRESGGRLLAAGVIGVLGSFASGQAVKILIRRPSAEMTAEDTEYARASYVQGLAATQPSSPSLASVALAVPSASAIHPSPASSSPIEEEIIPASPSDTVKDGHIPLPTDMPDVNEQDCIEVGRGLANYNSEQIAQVKGLNSSYLPRLLGYADSEYVVENITIRVPP